MCRHSDLCWNGVRHGDSLWEVRPGACSGLQLCVSHLRDKFNTCTSELTHIKSSLSGVRSKTWIAGLGMYGSPQSLSSCTTSSSSCTTSTFGRSASLFYRETAHRCTPSASTSANPSAESLYSDDRPHLVLLLLFPTVAIVTLGVGFHGHGGEEVLHGVVAQIITDSSEL